MLPPSDRLVCGGWQPRRPWSARCEHENGDLAVGLLLVLRVIGPDRDGTVPPELLLLAGDLARGVVGDLRAVAQFDVRVVLDVVVPDGMFRRPAERGHHGVLAVVLDPHERGLAQLAGLAALG